MATGPSNSVRLLVHSLTCRSAKHAAIAQAALLFSLTVGLAHLTGCDNGKTIEFDSEPRVSMPEDVPTYREITERQNRRVGRIEILWAPTRSTFEWTEEGKRKSESGEGHLIYRAPSGVALTFSKVGEIGFWAGCNDEMFWVFEGGNESVAYVARNENAFSPLCEPLPIAIHPLEVIDLIAFFPFPEAASVPVQYAPEYGAWYLDLPGRWSIRRVYLDPERLLPVRVELYDRFDTDRVLASATLEVYERLEILGADEEERPLVPSRMSFRQVAFDGVVEVTLHSPRDRTARGPVRPGVFEFEAVVASMKPERVLVLDEACPTPALSSPTPASRD